MSLEVFSDSGYEALDVGLVHVVDVAQLEEAKNQEEKNHYFGPEPEKFRYIPYEKINVAPQMRTYFDPEELDDLATSIHAAGLQNPLIVFEMSEELKDWYVGLSNEAWGGEIDSASYIKTEEDTYLVLVAGERRFRAINAIVNNDDIDPGSVWVTCQVRTCESQLDMMGSQVAENIYNAPRPFQYATIIHEVYRLGLEAGLYESEAEFIRDYSPAGRQATKNALLFYELPNTVRDYVAKDKLGYGHSLILFDYYQAYQAKLDKMNISEGEREELLQKRLDSRILKVIAEGWTKSQLEAVIPGWISELDFDQPGFFEEMFEDSSRDAVRVERKKIRDSYRQLFNGTGRALSRHTEVLALLHDMDEEMQGDLRPNIRRQLEVAKELYRTINKLQSGAIGELATELQVVVESILEQEEKS